MKPQFPLTLDLRNLPPPQPMLRILETAPEMQPGDEFCVILPHSPQLLYPRLQERGLEVITEQIEDHVKLTIKRPL